MTREKSELPQSSGPMKPSKTINCREKSDEDGKMTRKAEKK
uniref:Uncharacterized protein n=1 Tax=Nelumbo nucifera TaxID=4432 RepID=A0A822YW68_NELNU|nr:TPA_asm: hypothetical protein HUJ06_006250 [Nelumbo nucifera]